jgi:hypothetical protein
MAHGKRQLDLRSEISHGACRSRVESVRIYGQGWRNAIGSGERLPVAPCNDASSRIRGYTGSTPTVSGSSARTNGSSMLNAACSPFCSPSSIGAKLSASGHLEDVRQIITCRASPLGPSSHWIRARSSCDEASRGAHPPSRDARRHRRQAIARIPLDTLDCQP